MKRKYIALLLFLAILGASLSVFSVAFSDVKGHWAESSIKKWEKYEVVKGIGSNSFNPNGEMTRAEIATVISRLLSLTEKADISSFSDIGKNSWYRDAFEKCVAAGIYQGDGNKLAPNSPVTREMFFTLLARTFEIPGEKNINKIFDDTKSISSWAKEYTYAMINNGYVNGVSTKKIAPKESITRAAVISIIDRIVKKYVAEKASSITVEKNDMVIIKSDDCDIVGSNSGTVFFSGEGVSAEFKTTKTQRIVVTSSNVTLIGVPIGSEVIIKRGVKTTIINGVKYNGGTSFVLKKIDDAHKHVASAAVRENTIAGTCKVKSSYDEVVYCSVCGAKMSRKTVTGDYGNHDFVNGACKYCGITSSGSPTISVESVTASPGENVNVKIKIKNNPGLFGAILNIKFDSGLALTSATNGSSFSTLEMTKPGKYVSGCNFVWDGIDNPADKDGDVLTLTFAVASNSTKGKKLKISCSYVDGDIVDKDFRPVKVIVVDGGVTVK